MTSQEIAEPGDLIQWDFKGHLHEDSFPEIYTAKVAMVDEKNKCYGVYCKYGQDLIPFDGATIIEKAK